MILQPKLLVTNAHKIAKTMERCLCVSCICRSLTLILTQILTMIVYWVDILQKQTYTPDRDRTGKRYLRVYIQIRFRHACHETRDQQSRSLVSRDRFTPDVNTHLYWYVYTRWSNTHNVCVLLCVYKMG